MIQAKPAWVPDYVPALDGLRGVAILLVLVEHCRPRLQSLGLGGIAGWGWTGVDLFFVLSGYLITGIVLDGRRQAHFFRNFYARRALRIWPVYALVVGAGAAVFGGAQVWTGRPPGWLWFVIFAHNLMPGLNGALFPTWSLGIEEQFYLVWAPVARKLPAAAMGGGLAAILAVEPWVRCHPQWFVAVHTLYHLDGLALGALIALGLRARPWNARRWRRLGLAAALGGGAGVAAAARWFGPGINSALAVGFGGVVVLAVLGAREVGWLLAGPLRGLGRISYGLYMVHMPVFIYLGGIEARIHAAHAGTAGDLLIVAMRWTAAIAAAALLWQCFERPILRLKRHF